MTNFDFLITESQFDSFAAVSVSAKNLLHKVISMIVDRKHTVSEIAKECDVSEEKVRTVCTAMQVKLGK